LIRSNFGWSSEPLKRIEPRLAGPAIDTKTAISSNPPTEGANPIPAWISGRIGEKSSISARPKRKLAVISPWHALAICGPSSAIQPHPARTINAVAKSRDLRTSPFSIASFRRLAVGASVLSPSYSAI